MVIHKEILDMFTGSSKFQTKLSIVVVEDRKTSLKVESMMLPAILPSPKLWLNINFQN